ncbi:hypothetical protein IQ07DRAFT_554538 [Pyrenochaeta sp. DS3sAY3a]|nr:hypothetical protein IQ07DRAFT_554538 [Pyrenochaeta sp. DS3sAY3a]
MRLPPVEVLLSWPTPNYENPITRGNALIIVNSIFISLATLTLFTIGLTAVVLLANQDFGWDRHVYDIPFNKFTPTSKIAMAAKVVFVAAATFTRLSLQCFYYRLVSDTGKRWFVWLVHLNVAYTVGIFISFTFVAIFLCDPVRNYWIIGAPPETCMDEGVVTLICGIINCVADLVTTITPIPLVMSLQMPRRQRIAVAVLFGMGIIVTVAGIVRTWYIYRSLIGEFDQTWYAYPLWIAAAIEIDLGVICASAPVLRPLLAKIPFSLSETLSRGFSIKKSTGYASNIQTPQVSRQAPHASASSSKRRSEAIRGAPELSNDKGKSYEMKNWVDTEAKVFGDDIERGSHEPIIRDEGSSSNQRGISRLWSKIRNKDSKSNMADDMTITRTSEVELQIGPASRRQSKQGDQRPFESKRPAKSPLQHQRPR